MTAGILRGDRGGRSDRTGRGARVRMRLPRPVRITAMLLPVLAVVVVFFVGGVGQAVAQSFGYQPFLPGWRLSTDAYRQVWADPAVRNSLALTARVAVLSTAIAAVLGTAVALMVHRLGRRARGRWLPLLQTTLAVPHLVGALCMVLLLSQTGLLSRTAHAAGLVDAPADFPPLTADRFGVGIVAEYVWKETPFLAVLALTALSRGSDELADAARVLGAGPWRRLRHVTLPLLAPAVTAGSVLVFAFAAGSYEVPFLLGRPYPATLPVVAYQRYTDTDLAARPQAMAVAVLISLASMLVVAAYLAVTSRLARRPV